MKTEKELREKLAAMLAVDATVGIPGCEPKLFIGAKIGCCKTILWALGENDDDRWHIPARPGQPVDTSKRQ